MSWDRVVGQHRVKDQLRKAIRTGRLPHAFLFYGPEGVGKDAMAIELARALQCEKEKEDACGTCESCVKMHSLQHPNVKIVFALPTGKGEKSDDSPIAKLNEIDVRAIQEQLRLKSGNPYHRISVPKANIIKINSIREIRRESSMTTYGRKRRVVIISHAEEMGEEASNTLLKTLEEPSGETMLVLTTPRREALLPTIISRCQQIRFDPLTEEEILKALVDRNAANGTHPQLVARMANGSYARALDLLRDDIVRQREDVVAFIRYALAGNVSTLLEEIERLSAPRDRDRVVDFLTLMLMWFRDALVLSQGGRILNSDQQSDLNSFISRYPDADLLGVLEEVERAVSLVNKNVYISLALTCLAAKVRSRVLPAGTKEVLMQTDG